MSVRTLLVAMAVIVTACASPAATGGPTAAPGITAGSTPLATAAPTTAPSPTADLGHPVGVIAMGHSGLTGEGTAEPSKPNMEASWATGTSTAVDSIYLRMVAALPATAGHVQNTARGGAPASALVGQATSAFAAVPVPLLAIVQTVDNDIKCDGSNIAKVGQDVAMALDLIHAASPNTKILVVGQFGRPNVDFLKALVAYDPRAKDSLTSDDACSFFDAEGNLQVSGIQKLSDVIDSYEVETARVCALVPNCSTDGGVRRAWQDKIEYFSPDYAHLNVAGQAAVAEQMWPVVQAILGL